MERVFEKASAKINLTLDVLGLREDGYHDVEMIMTTIDLADRIELIARGDEKIVIECNEGFVPTDQRNLAYQAAALLQQKADKPVGVTIRIEKRIPVAAGLAGGSSDAAATLRGCNRLWNLGLSLEELKLLGAQLGSDVPFCVQGGTALAKGRGELVTTVPNPPKVWVVLAKPDLGVSTAEIYQQFSKHEQQIEPKTAMMLQALEKGSLSLVCQNLSNMLEPVTVQLYPEVRRIRDCMLRAGADGVLMSGSGPTVYAIAQRRTRAQRINNSLRGFCRNVYIVRLSSTSFMIN
ncbi:4-(cytidine 5'-diphospho)-2-C-methyl-D-erythritol kinase [Rubeoparvulum massiliense]|uniref:4-(cytidine 5'-diphospho)-2-C-methyl-D-erythritol kinase n=1 Tax=Rubeoparvulum massiliense TaxID=1631346 RepID=UPI00065E9400|nr:4-(cytidine 5'-diphospho)-2-C-methyl-D-erythritol kinase [Rubeoparvulum massiliense]